MLHISTLQHNHIMVVVRNNQKRIYLPILKEKEVYVILNFEIVPRPKQYRAVAAEYSINFYYKTKVQKPAESNIIPLYKFELRDFNDVNHLVGNVAMLIGTFSPQFLNSNDCCQCSPNPFI